MSRVAKRRSATVILTVGLALMTVVSAPAVDFFVSTSGDDAQEGTREQPFRTIRKAAEAMAPGDRCLVGAGEYAEPLCPARSGAFESPMIFATATGVTVTLTVGSDAVSAVSTQRWGIDLAGLQMVRVSGFRVRGGGINLSNARFCRVQDCHLSWPEAGTDGVAGGEAGIGDADAAVLLGGKENEVMSCSVAGSPVHGVVLMPGSANNRVVDVKISGAGTGNTGACGVIVAGAGHTVQRVVVEGSGGPALVCSHAYNARVLNNDLYRSGRGTTGVPVVRITGNGKGTMLAYNRIGDNSSCDGDGILLDGPVENYIVHHNVIWNQPRAAMHLQGVVQYCFVFNNTCARNGRGLDGGGTIGPGRFKGLRFFNNIFTGPVPPGAEGAMSGGIIWESNFVGLLPGFID